MQSSFNKGILYQIPLELLKPDPNQPRKVIDPEALEELADSIARHGVLQPILFRVGPIETEDEEPNLYIVAGERRVEAARIAGLTDVPALYVDKDEAEIALVENLLRQDLTAVEEAEALQRLMMEKNYTQEQLAAMIGKARTTVRDILTLMRLPEQIRDECRGDRDISRAVLIEIARKKQERAMLTAYKAYKDKLARQAEKTPRKKVSKDDPDVVLEMLNKTLNRIKSLNTSNWSDEDVENLRNFINTFQEELEAIMNKFSEQ